MTYFQIAVACAIGNVLVGIGTGNWANLAIAAFIVLCVVIESRRDASRQDVAAKVRARRQEAEDARRNALKRGGV